MNQRKRKRMQSKLAYSSCRVAAIMCREKRNCQKIKRKRKYQ